MALKKFSKSHHSTMNELNITPLLDLAFVLLVIFIIATTPMVNDLDLNLPTPNPNQKAKPQKKPNFLIIESDGRIFLNGAQFELAALRKQLVRMKQEDKETSVVVHGDSGVLYQNMVNIFDALQQADVVKVGLATERPSAAAQSNLN
jgi:biopolymer transport protein ExbD